VLVATWSGSLLPWEQELSAFKSQLSSAFGRAELWRSAGAFIDGLLSGVARKTGWQLAEQAGLTDALSESDLPWRVDIVEWSAVSPDFQARIERDKVVLRKPAVFPTP